MEEIRRRRRPRMAQEVTADVATDAPVSRRRRKSVTGINLKLAAPKREGYHRHWFVDKPGRLAEAEDLAYTHVSEPGIKTDSTDSRVRRLTGTDSFGAPQYSYLMETPLEEYVAGQADKEQSHSAFESAIQRGMDPLNKLSDAYGTGNIESSNRAG
ncbi:MAG: hypothetical protein V4657_07375 [Pseudomonadota bacterium]